MFHENRSHPRLWWMLFVSWLVLINYHSLQAHSLYVRMLNRRRTRAASTSFFIQKWRVDGKMDVAQRSFPTSESLLMHRLLVKIENSTHFWQATTFITFDHQKTSSITVTHEQDYWKKSERNLKRQFSTILARRWETWSVNYEFIGAGFETKKKYN